MSLPIAASKIVNLIPHPTMSSGWSAGTSDYYMGKPCRYLDSKSGSVEVTMATNDSIQLVKGHTYYARVSAFMRFGFGSTVDIYWPIAEPSFLSGRSLTKDKWVVCSNVIIRNSWSNGSYQLRLDNNNTTSGIRVYFAEAMLIDLTVTYGAGNEPSAAWCDENIPFFEGTYYTTPSAVTNLSAQADDGVVSLSWSSSDRATGYKVIRDGTQVSDQTGLTFVETVKKGTSYTYQVIAYNAGGESDPASITVDVPLVPPGTPQNFAASVSGLSATLSWDAPAKATGYRLYRDGVLLSDQTDTGYTDAVEPFVSYVYTLIAYNDDGESDPASISVQIIIPPETPSNFRSTSASMTAISLAWDAVTGADSYQLKRNGIVIYSGEGTSYTDGGLTAETAYTYTLFAVNTAGISAETTLEAATTKFVLVTDRTAADVDAGNDKGTYKASDLNRVGAAMNYVAARLREQGYDPHISPKTDWKDGDWMDPAAQDVYLSDLSELRKQFTMLQSTPRVPPRILATTINSGDGLTYGWANDIEQILMDIDDTLKRLQSSMFYSGELYSGEESI